MIGEDSIQMIDEDIVESDKNLSDKGEQIGEEINAIPIEINKRVASWIRHFAVTNRAGTIRYFKRGSAFKESIEEILSKKEVPKELFYLAMVESGFVTNATSTAKAVGVWQMMKGTARNYGLTVNSHIDERKNWIKSTFAAIDYLKDLRNVFGSWYLAFAAYNAGEYRIVRSIMKGKSRDFWVLAEGKMLPKETMNYVPKILAILIIAKHPERYGIRYEEKESWGKYKTVKAPSGIHLNSIEKHTGIPLNILKKWNKDLITTKIPYTKSRSHEIYIPESYASKVAQIENLRKERYLAKTTKKFDLKSPISEGRQYKIYVVENGDNLSKIAEILHLSVRSLKKINGIRKSTIYPGQKLRYYNMRKNDYAIKTQVLESKNSKAKPLPEKVLENAVEKKPERLTNNIVKLKTTAYHIVKKGDSLYSIARKYKTSVKNLAKINGIKNSMIYPGRKLYIEEEEKEEVYSLSKQARKPSSSKTKNRYEIVKGDSLYSLAKRFNTSVNNLIKINNLKNNTIHPGQRIVLED